MKKVGIISLYNNTNNYGGALQAYALCEYIKKLNIDCEQINYNVRDINYVNTVRCSRFLRFLNFFPKILEVLERKIYNKLFRERKKLMNDFLNLVPHSKLYTRETIKEANFCYDYFITGSDQVWNLNWYNKNMFLDFVYDDAKKISYAASFGKKITDDKQLDLIQSHLEHFSHISLRENDSISILESRLLKKIYHVLDPTLLLGVKDWDKLAIYSDKKYENYIFCYFLGDDKRQKKFVKKFAKRKKLSVYYVPHIEYFTIKGIYSYGKKIKDFSIYDFVNLIKNAEYVFTDSFHCAAFSCMYKRKFYVFDRKGNENMNIRLENLLEIFDRKNSFLKNANEIVFQDVLKSDDSFVYDDKKYLSLIENSKIFLKKSLDL